MSSHYSDPMSQRSQVSRIAPLGFSLMEVHMYRVPQKKVGLVENRLWQILMLIVRNPGAILDKSISVFIICLGYVQLVCNQNEKSM